MISINIRSSRDTILLLAIVGLAAVLRFWDLDRPSIWFDESYTWDLTRRTVWDLIVATARDVHPPLSYLINKGMVELLGDGETALRLPSTLFGIGAVWSLFFLGRALWDSETGLLAAFLLAISPFHVWFSTEARMYGLLSFAAIAFVWSLTRLYQEPRRTHAILAFVSGLALNYTHFYGSITFFSVNALIALTCISTNLIPPTARRCWLVSQLASFVLFIPWIGVLALQAHKAVTVGTWQPYPDLPTLVRFVEEMAGTLPVLGALSLLALMSGILRSGLMQFAKGREWRPDLSWRFILVFVWTFAPLVAGYLLSVLLEPILYHKYLSGAWPGFVLLAAAGATAMSRRVVPLAAAAILVVLVADRLDYVIRFAQHYDWRSSAATFLENRKDGDYLTFSRPFLKTNLKYYVRNLDGNETVDFRNTEHAVTAGTERLWMFARNHHGREPIAALKASWKVENRWKFHNVDVFLFVRP